MTAPAVGITGLTKSFGPALALADVSLDVRPGEFVSLLGPSGCGKTTLLRIIAGFDTPTQGRVFIHGQDVTDLPAERRPTNLVFQRGALFPHMTVGANIGYALRLRRWPAARTSARVDEMLALVRLDGLRDRMPAQLSGGQAQRVALARALAAEPKVLLLDEPLSALDLKLREQMQLELRAIQRQLGATFVFVTHDQTEALVMSDRIAILQGGRIVQTGSPQDIYRRPNSVFVSGFIGQANLMRGRIVAQDGPASSVDVGGIHLTGPTPPGMATGDAAILLIRPEALRLRRPGEAAAPGRGVEGRLIDRVYLGHCVRISVAGPGGTVLSADLREEEAEGLALGDSLALGWAATAPILMREDTA
jgi:ABC-type Fe3+/spermidine/putrescine transport system ATPase subunit